eukprot:tig00021680_g23042.t1
MDTPMQLGSVGKKDLLDWATLMGGRPVNRVEDLKDGVVLVRILLQVFPRIAQMRRLKFKATPRGEWERRENWESVEAALEELRVPPKLVDAEGVQAGRFKACYSALVLTYFLFNLARDPDFSADFMHPVDGRLAAFLQSPRSLECLARGGALDGPGSSRGGSPNPLDGSFASSATHAAHGAPPPAPPLRPLTDYDGRPAMAPPEPIAPRAPPLDDALSFGPWSAAAGPPPPPPPPPGAAALRTPSRRPSPPAGATGSRPHLGRPDPAPGPAPAPPSPPTPPAPPPPRPRPRWGAPSGPGPARRPRGRSASPPGAAPAAAPPGPTPPRRSCGAVRARLRRRARPRGAPPPRRAASAERAPASVAALQETVLRLEEELGEARYERDAARRAARFAAEHARAQVEAAVRAEREERARLEAQHDFNLQNERIAWHHRLAAELRGLHRALLADALRPLPAGEAALSELSSPPRDEADAEVRGVMRARRAARQSEGTAATLSDDEGGGGRPGGGGLGLGLGLGLGGGPGAELANTVHQLQTLHGRQVDALERANAALRSQVEELQGRVGEEARMRGGLAAEVAARDARLYALLEGAPAASGPNAADGAAAAATGDASARYAQLTPLERRLVLEVRRLRSAAEEERESGRRRAAAAAAAASAASAAERDAPSGELGEPGAAAAAGPVDDAEAAELLERLRRGHERQQGGAGPCAACGAQECVAEAASSFVWRLACREAALRERVERSAARAAAAVREARAARGAYLEARSKSEAAVASARREAREAVDRLREEHLLEAAGRHARIEAAEARAASLESELRSARADAAWLREAALAADEARFSALAGRVRSLGEEAARLRLRDEAHGRLEQVLRRALNAAEALLAMGPGGGGPDAAARGAITAQRHALLQESVAITQKLEALEGRRGGTRESGGDAGKDGDGPAPSEGALIKEAVAGARAELSRALASAERARERERDAREEAVQMRAALREAEAAERAARDSADRNARRAAEAEEARRAAEERAAAAEWPEPTLESLLEGRHRPRPEEGRRHRSRGSRGTAPAPAPARPAPTPAAPLPSTRSPPGAPPPPPPPPAGARGAPGAASPLPFLDEVKAAVESRRSHADAGRPAPPSPTRPRTPGRYGTTSSRSLLRAEAGSPGGASEGGLSAADELAERLSARRLRVAPGSSGEESDEEAGP